MLDLLMFGMTTVMTHGGYKSTDWSLNPKPENPTSTGSWLDAGFISSGSTPNVIWSMIYSTPNRCFALISRSHSHLKIGARGVSRQPPSCSCLPHASRPSAAVMSNAEPIDQNLRPPYVLVICGVSGSGKRWVDQLGSGAGFF